MAKLIITTDERKQDKVNGQVTFSDELIQLENDKKGIYISGKMTTHMYIDNIDRIETHRYILIGVKVIRETFGSNDFDILYEFEANDFIVKNGPTNLSNQLIEVIEMDIYKDEESDLWEGSDEWWN